MTATPGSSQAQPSPEAHDATSAVDGAKGVETHDTPSSLDSAQPNSGSKLRLQVKIPDDTVPPPPNSQLPGAFSSDGALAAAATTPMPPGSTSGVVEQVAEAPAQASPSMPPRPQPPRPQTPSVPPRAAAPKPPEPPPSEEISLVAMPTIAVMAPLDEDDEVAPAPSPVSAEAPTGTASKVPSKLPPAPGTQASPDPGWTPGPSAALASFAAPSAVPTTDIEELEADELAPESDRDKPQPPKPPPPPPPRPVGGEVSRVEGVVPVINAARGPAISELDAALASVSPARESSTDEIEIALDAPDTDFQSAAPAMPSKPPPRVSIPPAPSSPSNQQPPPPPPGALAAQPPPPPPGALAAQPPPPPAAALGVTPPPPPPAASSTARPYEEAARAAKAYGDNKKRVRPWWEEAFDDDFLRSMSPVTNQQIIRESAFIEDRLGLQKGAVVLDLACGDGRHAIELTRRGYKVVGYDLSLPMLALASEEAEAANQKINFLHGDMREMAFESMFDGVYCWGTSFGYFEEEKNFSVIQRIYRALRPGGVVLLDVVNRDFIAPRQPNSAWFTGEGSVCMDETNLDFITSRLKVKRTLMMEDGRTRELDYSIRLYGLNELGKVLHDAGFRVLEVSGQIATPGVFFGSESPHCIVLAERS